MIRITDFKQFQNPVPTKGDFIRITRVGYGAASCKIGDVLPVVGASIKKNSILCARVMIEGNKCQTVLSSNRYEWVIVGQEDDLLKEVDNINKKLDYIIQFINKITG